MSSNSFQGSGPDISSLLSMIQGGGPQNGGGQQQQQQQQQNQQLGGMQNSVGNYVHNNGGGSDPSAMSSLLQGLLGIGQQQQRNPRNGLNDVLSLLSAQQQLGQSGSGCQGVDLARLAASGLLGNLQQGGDHQSGQSQNLANFLGSQGNQSNQTQEQALALARMAGARLLSGDDTRGDPSRDANEAAKANLNRQTRGMESDNSSPFFAHRRNLIADTAADSARGRNLEPGAVAVPCRARGMPMDHNPLTAYFVINNCIQHGEDVVCSHPACRNAGIKFRYCSFCKAPVAKRNFRRRHNHGGENSTSGSDHVDGESAKIPTTSATSSRKIISASEEEPEAKRAKLIASSEDDDVETTTDSSISSSDNRRKASDKKVDSKQTEKAEPAKAALKIEAQSAVSAVGEADSSTATIKASGKSLSLEQRDRWATLLEERPITNDSTSMSAWIDKILKVSDTGQGGKSLSDAIRQVNRQD